MVVRRGTISPRAIVRDVNTRRTMLSHGSAHITTESWNGYWGVDACYYARRSDGVCFAIEGAMNVLDLAGATLPAARARPVNALPISGRFALRVVVMHAVDEAPTSSESGTPTQGDAPRAMPRLLAFGVRRRRR